MRKALHFFIAAILFYSCLEPTGENYVKIDPPDIAAMSINLAGISSDTIFIDRNTEFKYEVNGYPVYTTNVEVKLDNTPVYVNYGPSETGLFFVNPKTFKSGIYKLSVKFKGRPNNESLANLLDEERINVNGEYIVKIDSDPPAPIEIQKIDTTKGRLTIEWGEYKKKNFVSYQVVKCFTNYNDCKNIEILNSNTTSWTDTEYVGGKVTYQVLIKTTLYDTWETPVISKEFNWSPHFITSITDGIATIKWSNTPFYLNTVKAEIFSPFSNRPVETSITNNTYTTPERLNFGPGYRFSLKFYSSQENQSMTYFNAFFVGDKHDLPRTFPELYNSKADLYYGRDINRQTFIMNNKLDVINSSYMPGTQYISDNGEHFITLLDNNFYLTDPLTLATNLKLVTGMDYVTNVTVADNGLIGFYASGIYKVMSLATGEVKFTDEAYISPFSTLSRTGNYLLAKDKKVYHYDGTSFIYEGSLQEIDRYLYVLKFGKNDNVFSDAYYFDGSSNVDFVEFDIRSKRVIKSISFNQKPIEFQVDPITGKILLYESNAFNYLLNTNGTIKKVSESSGQLMSLFNNRLFAPGLNEYFSIDCSYIENR